MLREDVRCFSLARQSTPKKSSCGEGRQSKLNDSFHFVYFFVSALCVHIDLNRTAIKTLKKSEPPRFGSEYRGGSLKTPALSHSCRSCPRDKQLTFHHYV
jgi:hypothetical protein